MMAQRRQTTLETAVVPGRPPLGFFMATGPENKAPIRE